MVDNLINLILNWFLSKVNINLKEQQEESYDSKMPDMNKINWENYEDVVKNKDFPYDRPKSSRVKFYYSWHFLNTIINLYDIDICKKLDFIIIDTLNRVVKNKITIYDENNNLEKQVIK